MVQRPVTMGKLAVEHLVAQINGNEKESKDVDTGVTVVDASNLGSYTKYSAYRASPGEWSLPGLALNWYEPWSLLQMHAISKTFRVSEP